MRLIYCHVLYSSFCFGVIVVLEVRYVGLGIRLESAACKHPNPCTPLWTKEVLKFLQKGAVIRVLKSCGVLGPDCNVWLQKAILDG